MQEKKRNITNEHDAHCACADNIWEEKIQVDFPFNMTSANYSCELDANVKTFHFIFVAENIIFRLNKKSKLLGKVEL